jgi:short-subunit dehydrogenase
MPAAIVTGATSGIGRALALELARRGWDLGLTARRAEVLDEVAREIRGANPKLRVALETVDVSDAAAAREAVRRLFVKLGDIDLVVANAGIGGAHRIGTGQFAKSRDIVSTNLIGGMATVDARSSAGARRGRARDRAASSASRRSPASAACPAHRRTARRRRASRSTSKRRAARFAGTTST